MNPLPFAHAVALERATLLERWQQRFARVRAAAGRRQVVLSRPLLASLLDDIVAMLDATPLAPPPSPHGARGFAELAEFPASILVVLDCYQAGVQALGAFIVEQAGTRGWWDRATRNRRLGELDAIGRILAQREIHALTSLFDPPASPRSVSRERRSIQPLDARFSLHQRN